MSIIKRNQGLGWWVALCLALVTVVVRADLIVYENDSTRRGSAYNPSAEFGDAVTLSGDVSEANPLNITGAYLVVAPNGYNGTGSVEVKIYDTDATRVVDGKPFRSPKNQLGSGVAAVPAITRTTRVFVNISAKLTSPEFVWTANFSGLSSATVLGVMVTDSPSGGSSASNELWVKRNNEWVLANLAGGVPSNFGIILVGNRGSSGLKVGGGTATSATTTLSYREGTEALGIGAGSVVAFNENQTLEATVPDPKTGDELLAANGQKSDPNTGKITFTGSQGSVLNFLEGLKYENKNKSARAGAHIINFTVAGTSSSVTVNLQAVNDPPVVKLTDPGQATITTPQFAAGAKNPIEVRFTYIDPEKGVTGITVTALSDNEQVIKNSNMEIVIGPPNDAGEGTGILKIKEANVPTLGIMKANGDEAYPDGLSIAIVASESATIRGNIQFKLKVTSENQPPNFVIQNVPASGVFEFNEDTVLRIPFTLSDDKDANLDFSASSSAVAVVAGTGIAVKGDAAGSFLEITPNKDQSGETTLKLAFDDKHTPPARTEREVKIKVLPINDPPTLATAKLTYTEDEDSTGTAEAPKPLQIPFTVSDPDVGDKLELGIAPGVGEVTVGGTVVKLISKVDIVTAGTGAPYLNVTLAPNAAGGPAPIKLIARDTAQLTSELTFQLTVSEVNDPPQFAELSQVQVDGKPTDAIRFKVFDESPITLGSLSAVSDKVEIISNDFKFTQEGDFFVMSYKVLAFATGGDVKLTLTAKDAQGLNGLLEIPINVEKRRTPPFLLVGDNDTLDSKVISIEAENGATVELALGIDDLGTLANDLTVAVVYNPDSTPATSIARPLEVVKDTSTLGKVHNLKIPLIKGRSGTLSATITVTDKDGDKVEKTLIVVAKPPSAVNTPPLLDLGDVNESVELVVGPDEEIEIPFSIDDEQTDEKNLKVSVLEKGTSILGSLEDNLGVDPGDPTQLALLIRTPQNASGIATVELTVEDDGTAPPRLEWRRRVTIDRIVFRNRHITRNSSRFANLQVKVTSGSLGESVNGYVPLAGPALFEYRQVRPGFTTHYFATVPQGLSIRFYGATFGELPPTRPRVINLPRRRQVLVPGDTTPLKVVKTFKIRVNRPPTINVSENVAVGGNAVYPNLAQGNITIDEGQEAKPIRVALGDPDTEDADALTLSTFSDNPELLDAEAGGVRIVPLGENKFDVFLKPNLITGTIEPKLELFLGVSDPNDGEEGLAITVNVQSKNLAPVALTAIPDQTIKNNARFEFPIPAGSFDDPDPTDKGKLKFTASVDDLLAELSGRPTKLPTYLTLSEAGVLTYNPEGLQELPIEIISVFIIATDTKGASVKSAPFNINIIDGNSAPVFNAARLGNVKAVGGQKLVHSLRGVFTDPDGDTVTVELLEAPRWLELNSQALNLNGTPPRANPGKVDIKLLAQDTGGRKTEVTLTFTVEPPPNKAPVVGNVIANQNGRELRPITIAIPADAFTDENVIDGDKIQLSVSLQGGNALPDWLKFDGAKSEIAGTPPSGGAGNYRIVVKATDNGGESVNQTVLLTIAKKPAPVKLPVSFESAKYSVKEAETRQELVVTLVRSGDVSVPLEFLASNELVSPVDGARTQRPPDPSLKFSGAALAGVTLPAAPTRFDANQNRIQLRLAAIDDGLVTATRSARLVFEATDAEDNFVSAETEISVINVTGGAEAKYVNAAYLAMLNRAPTAEETQAAVSAIVGAANATTAQKADLRATWARTFVGRDEVLRMIRGRVAQRYLRVNPNEGATSLGGLGLDTSPYLNALPDLMTLPVYSLGLSGQQNDHEWILLAHHDIARVSVSDLNGLATQLQNSSRRAVAQRLVQDYRTGVVSEVFGGLPGQASGEAVLLSNGNLPDAFAAVLGSQGFFDGAENVQPSSPSVVSTSYPPSGDNPGIVIVSLDIGRNPGSSDAGNRALSVQRPLGVVNKVVDSGGVLVAASLKPPTGKGVMLGQLTGSFSFTRSGENSSSGYNYSVAISQGYSVGGTIERRISLSVVSGVQYFTQEGTPLVVPFTFEAPEGVTLSAFSANSELVAATGLVLGGADNARTLTVNPIDGQSGQTTILLQVKDGEGPFDQRQINVTVLPNAPLITRHPLEVVANSGTFATFDVSATGASLSYQWERFNSASSRWIEIQGQSLSSYTTRDVETVRVKVSNLGGTVTSDAARVVRPVPPFGVVSPAEGLTVQHDTPATFTVTQVFSSYDVPAPIVSWVRFNQDTGIKEPVTTGVSADGQTLTIAKATTAGVYHARIKDKYSEWESDPIRLRVRIPITIAEQPKGVTANLGQSVTLKVKANGEGPFEYQWRKNGSILRGVSGDTLTIRSVKSGDQGKYTVVVSQPGSESKSSDEAEVTVQQVDLGFNDDFANAGAFSGARGEGGGNSSSANSSLEVGEPRVVFNGPGGVLLESVQYYTMWAKWTAPARGVVTMETAGTTYDTFLGVYTGSSLGTLVKRAEDDDSGPNRTSRVTFNVTGGTEYRVRIGLRSGEPGGFSFSWSFTETAVTAPVILAVNTESTGSTTDAAAGNGRLRLTATVEGDAPLKYQWYRSNLALVDENVGGIQNTGSTAATFERVNKFSKLIGNYYLEVSNEGGKVRSETITIKKDGSGAGQKLFKQLLKQPVDGLSDTTLAKQSLGPLSRNLGKQALGVVELTSLSGSQLLLTDGQTVDSGEPNHAGVAGGASVWFSLKPTSTGKLKLSTEGETDFDTVLAVYTGRTNQLGFLDYKTLEAVASDDNSGADGITSLLRFQAVAGTEYFIAVDGRDGATGTLEFTYQMDVAPTLAGLKDYTIKQNSTGESILFKVDDSIAGPANLKVKLVSSNPTLIDPAKLVVEGSGGDRTIKFTPEFNQTGQSTLTLIVDDGVNVVSGNFKIVVEAVNQAPSASDVSTALAEDTEKALMLKGTDPEGKALTYKVLTQPLRGKLTGTAPNLVYTANANSHGTDVFTYSVNDGELESAPGSVSVTIVSVNDAPTISSLANVTGKAGTPTEPMAITLSDIDTALESVSVVAQSNNQVLLADANIVVTGNGAQRAVTLYPSAEKTGTAEVTLSAIDDAGATASTTFSITIASAPPTFSTQPLSRTVLEGESVAFFVQVRGTGPFTYQWKRNGQDVVSRTGGTLNIPAVTTADAGKYSVVVKSPVATITSAEADLVVTPKVVLPTKLTASFTPTGFALRFTSAPGPYRIQGSADLINWTTLVSQDATTGIIEHTDTTANGTEMRFYRVIQGR